MGARASPVARLLRAIERGQLSEAEAAARECEVVPLEGALGICILYKLIDDERFDRASRRFAARLATDHPKLTLTHCARIIEAVDELNGEERKRAMRRIALALRQAGLEGEAGFIEGLTERLF